MHVARMQRAQRHVSRHWETREGETSEVRKYFNLTAVKIIWLWLIAGVNLTRVPGDQLQLDQRMMITRKSFTTTKLRFLSTSPVSSLRDNNNTRVWHNNNYNNSNSRRLWWRWVTRRWWSPARLPCCRITWTWPDLLTRTRSTLGDNWSLLVSTPPSSPAVEPRSSGARMVGAWSVLSRPVLTLLRSTWAPTLLEQWPAQPRDQCTQCPSPSPSPPSPLPPTNTLWVLESEVKTIFSWAFN